MRIIEIKVVSWTLPLHAPFATAQRTAYEAKNVRVTVLTEDSTLWGEGACAPVFYVTGETIETVITALQEATHRLIGEPISRLEPLLARVNHTLAEAPSARAGMEMALYDVWARHWHLPLWQFFGGAMKTLTTDLTIPIVPPEEAGALAEKAWQEGFRNLKIKVGDTGGHEADIARVVAITRAAPAARLRIDANQGFTPDGAVAFAQALQKTGAQIELLEQPVPKEDIAGLRSVRERITIPVFADEAVQSVASALRLIREDAVDGLNIKLMKSGIAGSLQIIALCRAAGKKIMLGCMLESGLGIAAAAQIAGGTGAIDYLDLDSHRLLSPITGLSGGFICEGDQLSFEEKPGWGVVLPEN